MFLFCLVFAMSLCVSVYMCFVVTCWESADLFALVCAVYCELTGLSPSVKYFTDRSKGVLLLWIFYVFVLSCVCYVFVRV